MPGYFSCSRFMFKKRHFRWQFYVTFIMIFLFLHDVSAQDAAIDSLKKILPQLRDTARVGCLNRISAAYTKILMWEACYKQLDSARSYALLARDEGIALNHLRGVAQAYANLGELECEGGNFNKAEPFLKQSAEVYASLNLHPELNWVRITLGWSLFPQGKFTEARENLQKAAAYYNSVSNVMLESRAYRMIGNTYADQGYFLQAFENTQKAYVMGRKPGDTFGSLFSPEKKGDLFLLNEDTTSALMYYEESAKYAKSNGLKKAYLERMIEIHFLKKEYDSAFFFHHKYAEHIRNDFNDPEVQEFRLMVSYQKLGQLLLIFGKKDEAIKRLQEAVFFFKNTNEVNRQLTNLQLITEAFDKQFNNKEVLANAKQMIELGEKVGKRKFVRDGNWFVWRVYDREHNLPLAYAAHVKYSRLTAEIESDQHKRKIAVAEWLEKEKQLEAEVNILNSENEVKQAQLKTQLLIKKILVGGLVGFTLLGIILFRNLSLKRRNEKLQNETKQTALEKRATELEMQTLRAQMSPHFIFNSLNSINHFILQSDNVQASEYLAKFSRLIRLILQNSRAPFISLESELEALQLYLELEAVRFNHHFQYNINLEEGIDPSLVKVPPIIIQPYAENAIWHGLMQKEDRGKLDIKFFQRDGELFCEITDDGIGRDKARKIKSNSKSTHKSMGMKITAERLALLQKENRSEDYIKITDLTLADGTPGGTEVLLKIPAQYD